MPALNFLLAVWPRGWEYLWRAYKWPVMRGRSGAASVTQMNAFWHWAGLGRVKNRSSGHVGGGRAANRLARQALRPNRPGAYHNAAHNWHVMLMAALLGRAAGLGSVRLWLLCVAAMAHDGGYQPRQASRRGVNESRAAALASRILFRRGARGQWHRQLTALIMATSYPQTSAYDGASGDQCLAPLLRDADLFASHAGPKSVRVTLASRVKAETGSKMPASALLQQFSACSHLTTTLAQALAKRVTKPGAKLGSKPQKMPVRRCKSGIGLAAKVNDFAPNR